MSGHGDHSAETTQAERDLKRKEDERRLANLRDAVGNLSATEYGIASINAIRLLYGIGLAEAKDVHDGILMLTDRSPYKNPVNYRPTWRVVLASDGTDELRNENRRLTEMVAGLTARVTAFEKQERVREIDSQLATLDEDEKYLRERRESLYRDRDALTGDDAYPDDALDLSDPPYPF